MPAERLWTNQQIREMNQTVSTMRKIRTAATTESGPFQIAIGRVVCNSEKI